MKRNNKKGFTIVELVIVIAVIAILSAVLIPTFGTVIADANEVARDREASVLHQAYITACIQADPAQDPAEDLIIVVDDYYQYTVTGGQLQNVKDTQTKEANKIESIDGYTESSVEGVFVKNPAST